MCLLVLVSTASFCTRSCMIVPLFIRTATALSAVCLGTCPLLSTESVLLQHLRDTQSGPKTMARPQTGLTANCFRPDRAPVLQWSSSSSGLSFATHTIDYEPVAIRMTSSYRHTTDLFLKRIKENKKEPGRTLIHGLGVASGTKSSWCIASPAY